MLLKYVLHVKLNDDPFISYSWVSKENCTHIYFDKDAGWWEWLGNEQSTVFHVKRQVRKDLERMRKESVEYYENLKYLEFLVDKQQKITLPKWEHRKLSRNLPKPAKTVENRRI